MLLGKIKKEVRVPLSLKLEEGLTAQLEDYKKLYQEVHGEEIDVTQVVEGLLTIALKKDRAFQKYLKEKKSE
ncbi:DUF2274 domain-containing protein [Pseudoalteromonas marina]|uniref:DUF2274 domain-containing protein n=1 Tax=Pseudoalteromonas marina TaxID=267375 RepID=A0ABT9FC91_9GAMM|nr:DUF2274 domain-containing protein [Pseudoalteromonas marina]MDP2564400.1 DUF2274 domain-containing protein [Pseudoalteromonas marina]